MDIKYAKIDEINNSKEILKGEIENISVFYHKIDKDELFEVESKENTAKVFILADGEIDINGKAMKNKGIFAFLPEHKISIKGLLMSSLLEIDIITDTKKADKSILPYFLNYEDALTYTEACKSEKTISRHLLKQRIIPDLAIGSVEAYGPDEVGAHTHPYVEQLFFSFSENDMELVIDGEAFHMGGNTLVHIPLASEHGVLIKENQCAHYVWIDYITDEENGLRFLDTAHVDL